MKTLPAIAAFIVLWWMAPSALSSPSSGITPQRAQFGTMPDGTAIEIFTLKNSHGMEVRTIPYGAIIVSIRVPDRAGRLDDVVIGHDRLEGRAHALTTGMYDPVHAEGRW